MTVFKERQPVKLARPTFAKNEGLIGKFGWYEYTPAGTECDDGLLDADCDCIIFWDDSPHTICFQQSDQLEPIQDNDSKQRSDHETIPWELCCFTREGKYVELETA